MSTATFWIWGIWDRAASKIGDMYRWTIAELTLYLCQQTVARTIVWPTPSQQNHLCSLPVLPYLLRPLACLYYLLRKISTAQGHKTSFKPFCSSWCFADSDIKKSCMIRKSRPWLSRSEEWNMSSMMEEDRSIVIKVGRARNKKPSWRWEIHEIKYSDEAYQGTEGCVPWDQCLRIYCTTPVNSCKCVPR